MSQVAIDTMGLSPRVRGNLLRAVRVAGGYHRSIPACAGEPAGYWRVSNEMRVYPRVCGGTPSTCASDHSL